jgi:hypothetical protein
MCTKERKMAGYNVQTPALFAVKDPQQLVDFNLNTLNARFTFRDLETVIGSQGTGPQTYSADAILGGYIIRRNAGFLTDDLADATDILDALYRKLWAIGNNDILPNGSTFTCTLYMEDGPIFIDGANGTVVVEGNIVDQDTAAIMTFMIVDQARLGQGHSDLINVCICGGSTPFIGLNANATKEEIIRQTIAAQKK